jgi:hypothetical protein
MGKRGRKAWIPALHRVAILAAMNILLLSDIRQLVPSPAISIIFLTLLALFLPVSVSPRNCFLGAAWLSRYPRRMVQTVGAVSGLGRRASGSMVF